MTTPVLAVSGVRFTYSPDSNLLFDGLTHEFRAGTVTAVTGPSGCGKSTLLYLLGLMLRPDAGHVHLDGRRVSSDSDADRSRKIGRAHV